MSGVMQNLLVELDLDCFLWIVRDGKRFKPSRQLYVAARMCICSRFAGHEDDERFFA